MDNQQEAQYYNGLRYEKIPIVNGKLHGIIKWYNKKGDVVDMACYVYDVYRSDLLEEDKRLERLILFGTQEI